MRPKIWRILFKYEPFQNHRTDTILKNKRKEYI